MKLKRILFAAMVLLVITPAIGRCFDVTAQVDKTRISREDSVFLKVEVNGGKADLDLSMIKDFKVISRGTASSYNYINGKSEHKATYQYVLIPLKEGELKIPAITALRDGESAATKEIVIQVSNQVVNPDEIKALSATAEVAQSTLFVGQQTLFSLKFYTSRRLSGLGFETPPEFKGFSAKPFEKEKTYTQTINGVLFQVTQVDYIILPTGPGAFTIDPAVLIANVVVKSNRDPRLDSFFNDSFFSSNTSKPVRVASNPVKIEVSPLPPYKAAGKFSGLVGRFEIEGNVDKTRLNAGESATFTIRISGSGNIMDASLPEIDMDTTAFKVYDDNPVETIHLTEKGYEGEKIFKKAIVPVNPGEYVIKKIVLTYFDVDQQSYQTVSTEEISLSVIPSEAVHLAVTPSNGRTDKSVKKEEVALINTDILEIKEGLEVLKDYRELDLFFFLILLSIPGVLFSGVKLFTLVQKKEVSVEKKMEEKAKHHLKQAGKMKPGDERFLGHLYSGLVAFVLARGKKRGETVTAMEARAILTHARADETQIAKVTDLLDTIESVRFGGRTMDEKKATEMLSQIRQVMKMICLAVICLGVLSFSPYTVRANPAATFLDGIKSYRAEQFKKAAKQFETLAQNNIKNPYLFYNIANAYLKANDIGQAILWYERARVMLPNDPDLNFNLEYANTLVKDKKETPLDVMEILFFWDSLVPAKVIQFTSIFFSFVFFAWASMKVLTQKKIFSGTGILLCSIFVLVTAITCVTYYKRSVRLSAVIVQQEVAVRSGVTDTATELFSLHAGTKVTVEEQRDGYLKIVFSKGKVGWVKAKQAIII